MKFTAHRPGTYCLKVILINLFRSIYHHFEVKHLRSMTQFSQNTFRQTSLLLSVGCFHVFLKNGIMKIDAYRVVNGCKKCLKYLNLSEVVLRRTVWNLMIPRSTIINWGLNNLKLMALDNSYPGPHSSDCLHSIYGHYDCIIF